MRPATSDMGVSSGSSPVGSCTVSYAIAIAPESITARVRSSAAAKWKYVKMTWSFRIRGHSAAIGSFTFMIMSARCQTSSAVPSICAPAFTYASSGKPLPSPAVVSTTTVCPA
jgi:hypothetical protein